MRYVRSVFVFSAADPTLIGDRLDSIGQRSGADSWVVDERLWVYTSSPPNWWDGFENVRADIERHLGSSVTLVAADVSSKIDGNDEVRSFALAILALGRGLAFDDDAQRGWTDEQLLADEYIDGRRFFNNDER
jgi:hypothetical protein